LPLSSIATTTQVTTTSDQPLTQCDIVSREAANRVAECAKQLQSQAKYSNQTDKELEQTCQTFPAIAQIYNERTTICGPNPYDEKNTANTTN
jgi:hypothetical protein